MHEQLQADIDEALKLIADAYLDGGLEDGPLSAAALQEIAGAIKTCSPSAITAENVRKLVASIINRDRFGNEML